jgi:phosphatidylserine/phosphatidylglycerophosphate/cardiolipin synthase-like enzyme
MRKFFLLIIISALLFSCSPKYSTPRSNYPTCPPSSYCNHLLKCLLSNSVQATTQTGAWTIESGGMSFFARAWLLESAKRTIDIQYYIFARDNTGLLACDYLVRAAERGVKVRLLLDDLASKMAPREIKLLDSHENIEIRIYNPGVKHGSAGSRLKMLKKNIHRVQKRMHTKTLTIDDEVSVFGGRNIADEYFDWDERYNFRDRDLLVVGRHVKTIRSTFEEFWNSSLTVPYDQLHNDNGKKFNDPARFAELHRYACDTNHLPQSIKEQISAFPTVLRTAEEKGELLWTTAFSFVADEPGKNEDRPQQQGGLCMDSLMPLLKNAKKSVDIQSPYLITTELGKSIIKELVKKGVRVRVITNSLESTDNLVAYSGYQRDRKKTLATGIEVYEFKPHPQVRYSVTMPEMQAAMNYTPVLGLHSKTMLIDGEIAVVGSFNIDPRSVNLNTECLAIIRSPKMVQLLSRHLEEEMLPENAWRITENFNPDKEAPLKKRLSVFMRRIFPKKFL